MKAYHILMFLFLFNLMFWVITAGLGIYDVGVNTDPGFDLSEEIENPTSVGLGLLSVFTMFGNAAATIIGLSLAIAGGAMLGFLFAGQGSQGIVYGLFGYFFWASFSNTLNVFWALSLNSVGILYVIVPFTMVVGVIFVVGLFQMVTGGWKGHE